MVAGVVPLVALSFSQLVLLAPSAIVNACADPSDAVTVNVVDVGADVLESAKLIGDGVTIR
jgi:hypothetical protein